MSIGRGNQVASFAGGASSKLVKMDQGNKVLGANHLFVLGDVDRAGDSERLLNERGGNGNHALYSNIATFLFVRCFPIPGSRWEIGVEIGVAKTPGRRNQVMLKPGI